MKALYSGKSSHEIGRPTAAETRLAMALEETPWAQSPQAATDKDNQEKKTEEKKDK